MSELLEPGAVSVTQAAAPAYWPGSGVVGSPPQWADGSDATYAVTGLGYDEEDVMAREDIGHATFPQSALALESITDIIFRVRTDADHHEPSEDLLGINIGLWTPGIGGSLVALAGMTAGDPIATYTIVASELAPLLGLTIQEYIDIVGGFLTVGPTDFSVLIAGTYFAGDPVIGRVYELSIELVAPDPVIDGDFDGIRRIFA